MILDDLDDFGFALVCGCPNNSVFDNRHIKNPPSAPDGKFPISLPSGLELHAFGPGLNSFPGVTRAGWKWKFGGYL